MASPSPLAPSPRTARGCVPIVDSAEPAGSASSSRNLSDSAGPREAVLPAGSRRAPRVLIVDDDPDIRESTAMLLALSGFDVRTHGDAEGILERIGAERPDVVLQDVMMPGLDLRGLMRRLRNHAALRRVPIVLFSASVDVEATAREVGADGGVGKPFEAQVLVRALERFTGRVAS